MSHKFYKPFLKWPGNKYRILPQLLNCLPPGEHLVEPFVGSAAIFLNTQYKTYHLNDVNPDLIHLYQYLQREGMRFIAYAQTLFTAKNNEPQQYYCLRERFNQSKDHREKSRLFLYLNRHGFNGLCRYNQSGQYNVPFGDYRNPYFPKQEMLDFYRKSKGVTFSCQDFTHVLQKLIQPSIVYCDPPYVPLNNTAHFTSYSGMTFSLEQQQQLARMAQSLAKQGIPVLISNHDTPWTRKIYHGAKTSHFMAPRLISCKAATRKPVKELVALFQV